jgi:hypothetical protein
VIATPAHATLLCPSMHLGEDGPRRIDAEDGVLEVKAVVSRR